MRPRNAVGAITALLSLLFTTLLVTAGPARAATLEEVTDFRENPSGLRMHLYVPDSVRPEAAVLVAVHWCTGSGPAMHSSTEFASLADQHGFIVVYPSATRAGNCFDVASSQALRRDGGSDPVSIAAMVRYVQENYSTDPSRVFVAGVSSGAMMTNVLLGNYPDLFAGGAAFAGVPHSCFAGPGEWNSQCADGQLVRSPREWGDAVRAAYPDYDGPRPRVQLWHGTNDETLDYQNFTEEIKQWTDVLGVSQDPTSSDTPRPGWDRTRYADADGTVQVEAVSLAGVSHDVLRSGMAAEAIAFFGLDT